MAWNKDTPIIITKGIIVMLLMLEHIILILSFPVRGWIKGTSVCYGSDHCENDCFCGGKTARR